MADQKLLDCFKPRPLPPKAVGQTYQPKDHSWYETKFLYRVAIKSHTFVTTDDIMFRTDPFFRTKEEMQAEPARWGVYREDWFATINSGVNYFYFMTRNKALEFRLWTPL